MLEILALQPKNYSNKVHTKDFPYSNHQSTKQRLSSPPSQLKDTFQSKKNYTYNRGYNNRHN